MPARRTSRRVSPSDSDAYHSPDRHRDHMEEGQDEEDWAEDEDLLAIPELDEEAERLADPKFPSPHTFNLMVRDYLRNLSVKKRAKALLTRKMYASVLEVLKDPKDTSQKTAQFRFWVKKMFQLTNFSGEPVVCHDHKPVAVKEHIYDVLCHCHNLSGHGGRDKTSSQVRKFYSWIPKEIIARFVRDCPYCMSRRTSQHVGKDDMTRSQAFLISLQEQEKELDGSRPVTLAQAKGLALALGHVPHKRQSGRSIVTGNRGRSHFDEQNLAYDDSVGPSSSQAGPSMSRNPSLTSEFSAAQRYANVNPASRRSQIVFDPNYRPVARRGTSSPQLSSGFPQAMNTRSNPSRSRLGKTSGMSEGPIDPIFNPGHEVSTFDSSIQYGPYDGLDQNDTSHNLAIQYGQRSSEAGSTTFSGPYGDVQLNVNDHLDRRGSIQSEHSQQMVDWTSRGQVISHMNGEEAHQDEMPFDRQSRMRIEFIDPFDAHKAQIPPHDSQQLYIDPQAQSTNMGLSNTLDSTHSTDTYTSEPPYFHNQMGFYSHNNSFDSSVPHPSEAGHDMSRESSHLQIKHSYGLQNQFGLNQTHYTTEYSFPQHDMPSQPYSTASIHPMTSGWHQHDRTNQMDDCNNLFMVAEAEGISLDRADLDAAVQARQTQSFSAIPSISGNTQSSGLDGLGAFPQVPRAVSMSGTLSHDPRITSSCNQIEFSSSSNFLQATGGFPLHRTQSHQPTTSTAIRDHTPMLLETSVEQFSSDNVLGLYNDNQVNSGSNDIWHIGDHISRQQTCSAPGSTYNYVNGMIGSPLEQPKTFPMSAGVLSDFQASQQMRNFPQDGTIEKGQSRLDNFQESMHCQTQVEVQCDSGSGTISHFNIGNINLDDIDSEPLELQQNVKRADKGNGDE